MTRVYLHLRDETDEIIDTEGLDMADAKTIQKAVNEAAREMMGHDVMHGQLDMRIHIDAEDENGKLVYRLSFKDAVKLIQTGDGADSTLRTSSRG